MPILLKKSNKEECLYFLMKFAQNDPESNKIFYQILSDWVYQSQHVIEQATVAIFSR